MKFIPDPIEELIAAIQEGKPVVLLDDEDRENEGDLVVAAQKITPELINFMITNARGLVCLTLTQEQTRKLNLPLMVTHNQSAHNTPFTLSIDARQGVSTGISAYDRALTILKAADPKAVPSDVVTPGHIFPLQAAKAGVLERAGHTEAGCDLAKLAGLWESAVIVEILHPDGTMARRDTLMEFARLHGLKIGTIADLIHYRLQRETTIRRIENYKVMTKFGEWEAIVYQDLVYNVEHLAFAFCRQQWQKEVLTRIHSGSILLDVLPLPNLERWSAYEAMKSIHAFGSGLIVFLNQPQKQSIQTTLATLSQSSYSPERKTDNFIGIGSQILRDLQVHTLYLMAESSDYNALDAFHIKILRYCRYSDRHTLLQKQ